jgi:hypothetical protein
MKLEEGVDYYIDEKSGLMVLTSFFLQKRGYCCKNFCKNCPYGYIKDIYKDNNIVKTTTKTTLDEDQRKSNF